eukprot:contig_30332_g7425
MAPGRGSRIAPPDGDLVDVDIPRALVEDTVKELTVSGRGDSLRQRLNEFTALYKYVLDTLVKRQCADPVKREKVNHPYIGITPEAVRGKKVSFTMASGKRWTVTSPTFFNSRNMKIPTTLAVILLMKHTGDPFVHWLIGLFCGGAMAPADVAAPAQATAGKNKTARVSDGGRLATYPFGQHEHLCLEKGNPSTSPVLLGTIDQSYRLAWPVADVGPPADSSDVDRAEQLQAIIAHMPAVEVFAVQCVVEHATKYYPFSSAIYESEAYQKYRKPHFPDYILPRVMSDLPGAAGNEPQRDLVLWDARFLTG